MSARPSRAGHGNAVVTRLNEIWHDLENRGYQGKHPDIEEEEAPRWRRHGSEILGRERGPWSVLDVGCGTGFVPLQLLPWLRPADRLTCADLSAGMLSACAENLAAAGRADAVFLKLDGMRIGLPDGSQNVVTVNAVLHHLAEPETLCKEIDRVLAPGGGVLIGHEPNRLYAERRGLALRYFAVLPWADFRLFAYEILLRLGGFERLRRPLGRFLPELGRHNALVDRVNAKLLEAGAVERPLAAAEMSSLLDANSPTAGGSHPGRGFTAETYRGYFPGYSLEFVETYKHLGKLHPRRAWARRYEKRLARKFPDHGSTLFAVLRKPG